MLHKHNAQKENASSKRRPLEIHHQPNHSIVRNNLDCKALKFELIKWLAVSQSFEIVNQSKQIIIR